MSSPLTKEEIRNARLLALGQSVNPAATPAQPTPPNTTDDATAIVIASGSTASMDTDECHGNNGNGGTVQQLVETRPLSSELFASLQLVMYKGGNATQEDMLRWYEQGFQFCKEPFFGLRQGNGGPCGILAVVQAEMLAEMLFEMDEQGEASEKSCLPAASEVDLQKLLSIAMCNILQRASNGGDIVILSIPETFWRIPLELWDASQVFFTSYANKEAACTAMVSMNMQAMFRSGMGCIAFLGSLICTRGVDNLKNDMDDSGSTLIGQFGHCNQDLINLLLTGRATSNVIDGEMELGDSGLMIRGVQRRSRIGYLTQLEALRYCEVGNYLKVPELPVWVVGSSSHFSVLFSLNRKVNEESHAQKLLSTLQRCFKAVDRAECGFIPATALKQALEQINLHDDYANNPVLSILNNETDLARLRGHLQIDGEIILWSAFWVNVSSLMSGSKNLDELIASSGSFSTAQVIPEDNISGGGRKRSDSELARELQAEMNGEVYIPPSSVGPSSSSSSVHNPFSPANAQANTTDVRPAGNSASMLDFSSLLGPFSSNMSSSGGVGVSGAKASTANPVTSPTATSFQSTVPSESRVRSDSEIARELQAQWDAEEAFVSVPDAEMFAQGSTRQKHSLSMDVHPGKPEEYQDLPELLPAEAFGTPAKKANLAEGGEYVGKMPSNNPDSLQMSLDDAQQVELFEMFHFNGMESTGRSARLSTFQLSVRSSINAVGVTVAFQGGEHNQGGGFNSPLEEVLRTRWPGCKVDFKGQPVPSID